MRHRTKTAKETRALAKKFVAALKTGGVFGLIGDLGAGKTTFTQGVARALGIKGRVTSPTFVLLRTYQTKHKKIKQLVHVDAYRITKAASLAAIGLADFMADPKNLVLIEWADKVKALLPRQKNKLFFAHAKNGRVINLPSFLTTPRKPAKPRQKRSASRPGLKR